MSPTGALLVVLGVFVIARLVTKDSTGETLAGRLAGGQPNAIANTSAAIAGTSAPSAPSTGAASTVASMSSALTGTINASGLQPIPEGTKTPATAAGGWADAILSGIGAPLTSANIAAMEQWFDAEGGGGENNPTNTTLAGVGTLGDLPGNSARVKNYATPADGVTNIVDTLLHTTGNPYSAIVASLRAGMGLPDSGEIPTELNTWGTGAGLYYSVGSGT
jgi:hypothetical protein